LRYSIAIHEYNQSLLSIAWNILMKHTLTFLILLLVLPALAAEEKKEEKKYEFTEEQLQGLKQQEEKYKDNPAMLNVIEKVKKGLGITDEDMTGSKEKQSPPAVEFNASKKEADAAYRNKDYATAFKHYQKLADEGDAEASMKLGIMYEGGIGTEKDSAAAHAYYRKAAEGGADGSEGLLELVEETGMTEEDLQRSDEQYNAIGKPVADSGQKIISKLPGIQSPSDMPGSLLPANRNMQIQQQTYVPEPRLVRLSPEKIKPMKHPGLTTGSEPYQPEKYTRKGTELIQFRVN